MNTKLLHNVIGFVYNSDSFMHHIESKRFSADISEVPNVLRQLWDDALDTGFVMRSKKTGSTAFFTLKLINRDSDGDITSWEFDIYRAPNQQMVGYTVVIFND